MDNKLKSAWRHAGFDQKHLADAANFPVLEFGSWVGGDRDGHPFVTPEFTAETLKVHRKEALLIHKESIETLLKQVSFSEHLVTVPGWFMDKLKAEKQKFGNKGKKIVGRNPEPWRQYASLMLHKINNSIAESVKVETKYTQASELLADPQVLKDSLREIKDERLVDQIHFSYPSEK